MASYNVPISDEFARSIERQRAYERARREVTFLEEPHDGTDDNFPRGMIVGITISSVLWWAIIALIRWGLL